MKVNSINNNYKTQPNFKALVLHGNSKQILTKGSELGERTLKVIEQNLSKTKDFDLHVEPLTKDDVYLFWTKKDGKNPVMECSISSYDTDTSGKNVGIYAINPYGYDDGDFCAVLEYKNERSANKALNIFNKSMYAKTPLQKLSLQAKATLAIEQAKKMQLKSFYCWDKVKKDMPEGNKILYEYKSPWQITKDDAPSKLLQQKPVSKTLAETTATKTDEVHYNFADRLRILFGLQPKK